MLVTLYEKDGTRRAYDFDPTAQKWSLQAAGGAHLIGLETRLPNELAKVFVKRWNQAAAPGNRLLMEAITKPLPNTPRVLGGDREDSGNHYYFFPDISSSHRLLDHVMKNRRSVQKLVLQDNIGLVVCKSAASFLQAVNDRGYVYPDFTHKNIMIGRSTDCSFIDVDSCFPTSELSTKKKSHQDFAMVYWSVWRNIVGVETEVMLSRTMVLSFAVVWARAAALLRQGADVQEVQSVILNPTEQVQAPFWLALKDQNLKDFAGYLAVAETQTKSFFDAWTRLLVRLRRGDAVAWAEIVKMAEATLKAGRESPSAAPSPPPPPPIPKTTCITAPPLPQKTGGKSISVMQVVAALLLGIVLVTMAVQMPKPPQGKASAPFSVPVPAQGPSFDCVQVSSGVLKTICADNELSSLDRKLASLYGNLTAQPTVDKDALKISEQQWILTRENCRDRSCIEQRYRQRLATLDAPGAYRRPIEPAPARPPAPGPSVPTDQNTPPKVLKGGQIVPPRKRVPAPDSRPAPQFPPRLSPPPEQPSPYDRQKADVTSQW